MLKISPVLGISPFEFPDVGLIAALCRAGAIGVLDLGRDPNQRDLAIQDLAHRVDAFGVRIPRGVSVAASDLPKQVKFVVLTPHHCPSEFAKTHIVLCQVTSIAQALVAEQAGAHALIAKGSESGGEVGNESAFILLQSLQGNTELPIWVQGGIGLHTAAAAMAGGAEGVVLDSQLALVRESGLPEDVKHAVQSMDGSETVIVAGHRVYSRPDLPVASLDSSRIEDILPRLGGSNLKTQLLAVGQEGANASNLAKRFATAGGVVAAFNQSMTQHLECAERLNPLGPDSPLAERHGTRYPIVQGPMTRVSDTAAFADAVSQAGGLPFLALALSRGARVRELLEETKELLGDRPFGVGILGFVPPSLREEQLAVIREIPP
ncbi:MAG TPA: hypothetical protein EYN66_05450, partial [Myxococcales bacterium]|nr:hypothetical protein [Myxococcales bacterium]